MRLSPLPVAFALWAVGWAYGGVVLEPAGDKHMYPFIHDIPPNDRRPTASVFGAYGALDNISGYDFDDRDAQFFLDFSTSSLVAPGQGASKYQVTSLEIWVVVQNNGRGQLPSSLCWMERDTTRGKLHTSGKSALLGCVVVLVLYFCICPSEEENLPR